MAGYPSGTNRLYRSRRGEFLGVCQGIADWKDFPVGSVRLGFILLALFTAFMPVLVFYLILAIILPLEPEYREEQRRENRRRSSEDVQADFENLKERVKRMEDEEFDKERDWDERFRKGR